MRVLHPTWIVATADQGGEADTTHAAPPGRPGVAASPDRLRLLPRPAERVRHVHADADCMGWQGLDCAEQAQDGDGRDHATGKSHHHC